MSITNHNSFSGSLVTQNNYQIVHTNESTCPLDSHKLMAQEMIRSLNQHKVEPITFDLEGHFVTLVSGKTMYIEKASSGIHGTPILMDKATQKPIAAFKADNAFFTTTNLGDIIAFQLDHDSFAKVPPAFRALSLPASFPDREQYLNGTFVKWLEATHTLSISEELFPNIEQRQAIAILDIRLGNDDRNRANILQDEKGNLYPIDHDRIFSNFFRYPLHSISCYSFERFTEKAKDYIRRLDIQQDVDILRRHHVTETQINNLVIRTVFLKLAVEADLRLGQLEKTIQSLNLPAGYLQELNNRWISTHPLHKILGSTREPYDSKKLMDLFQQSFEYSLFYAERFHIEYSYSTWYKGAFKVVQWALCTFGS